MPMTTLTPTDEFSEPVQVEANGTVISKEGIGDLGLQRLANQATFLRNRTPGADAGVPVLLNPIPRLPESGDWVTSSVVPILEETVTTETLYIPWTPPPKGTLTRIDLLVHGLFATTTHAALPGTMPSLQAQAFDLETNTRDDLGTVSDPSASKSAYEVAHEISLTGLSVDLEGKAIDLIVNGEQGANSKADAFAIFGVRFWVTP